MEPAPQPSAPAAGPGAGFTLPARLRAAQPWGPALATGGRPARPRDPARPRVPQPLRVTRGRGLPAGGASGPRRARGRRGVVDPGRARLAAPQPRSGERRGRPRAPGDRGRSCGVRPAPRARRRRSPAATAPRPSHRLRPPPAPRALRDGLPLLGNPTAPHRANTQPRLALPQTTPHPSTVANDKPVGEVCFLRRLGGQRMNR